MLLVGKVGVITWRAVLQDSEPQLAKWLESEGSQ